MGLMCTCMLQKWFWKWMISNNICTQCFEWFSFLFIQKYQCIQEYGRNMPRLMKCRFNKKKNKRMQRDGYFSKKRCPCGRKKNKLNPDEKLSQTEFLMKYASKGKCWCFFYNANWNIMHDLDKIIFFVRFTLYFIWCDKMIVLWTNIFFFFCRFFTKIY